LIEKIPPTPFSKEGVQKSSYPSRIGYGTGSFTKGGLAHPDLLR